MLCLSIAGLVLIIYHAWRFFHSPFFELKKVVIRGVSDTVVSEIRALTRLEPQRRINLLFLPESRIRETVLKHPRLESAAVTKILPNAVIIEATERKPTAIVASGALHLIDNEGYVLDTLTSLDKAPRELPFITGIEPDQIVLGRRIALPALGRALDLFECLRRTNPELAAQVSEVRIERDEGLTLILAGGVEVRLGVTDFRQSLPALELFFRKYPDLNSIEYLDLRFKDQIVYRLRDGGSTAVPPAGERTWDSNPAKREL
ncbi:MAG: cell division protein FtsQ/DivIB [Candidatus Sumerlaeia bacterium]|nr:cell division protein FtsQ/DivIB [Candidatus Sumerlaeia bacterium]